MPGRTRLVVPTLLVLSAALPATVQGAADEALKAGMVGINAQLASKSAPYRVGVVEYITAYNEIGRTVFFSDVGNKMLSDDFVPGDPRRVGWSGPVGPGLGDNITWTSDTLQGAAPPLALGPTQAAIVSAMATWQAVNCATIPLAGGPFPIPVNLGVAEFIFTGGASGLPFPVADYTHAGFGTALDAILLPPIVGVTVTFVFIDGSGNPTDIDHNGKADVAFRESYYTANFPYGINTNFPIDVQSIVLHEAGHGQSQAHFGTLFRTDSNGLFHFAPRAVMNAAYTGIQQQLTGSDIAGHCANWASWPLN